ncbi:hypothetical protein Mapa_017450 [Marchantia paleacea]|nr:hypothetical protein Mapa_017450 [Marchantia paleacea]
MRAMVPVSGDDAVLGRQSGLHPHAHGLLAIVQVTKSPNELRLVERIGRNFHPPHAVHGLEEAHELLGRRLHGQRWGIAFVRLEGRGDVDCQVSREDLLMERIGQRHRCLARRRSRHRRRLL